MIKAACSEVFEVSAEAAQELHVLAELAATEHDLQHFGDLAECRVTACRMAAVLR